jgi:proteasome lid subunit RPN8/RPN11
MPLFERFSSTHSAAAEPESYTWACPGAPVRVHLPLSLVELMGREVKRAFESVPAHSVEIGGLLLGTAGFATNPIIKVKDFEPFLSEYRTDHKFILSEADERKLEKVLAAHANNRMDGLKVVGFYRSHIGEGLSLSQQDISLAQKYFRDPTQVILAIKPAANGSSTAGFFFWDDRRIDSQFSYMEFPFETRQLTGTNPAPISAEPAETKVRKEAAAQSDLSLPSLEELALEPSGPRPIRFLWYVLVAILMVGLGAAGYWTYMTWNAPPAASAAQESTALALQVERKGSDLRVSWNRHSFAIARAIEGALVIRDGDLHEQQLRFDLDELRHGSILYTPANPAVQFRLEVTDQENVKTSETVLALTAAKADAAAGTTGPAWSGNSAPADGTARAQSTPPSPAGSDFGEPVRLSTVAPPASAPGASGPDAASKRGPAIPQPTLPPQPVEADPAAEPYTPPQPMKEVQPTVLASASVEVTSLIEVEIRVHIDDRGVVVKAEPVPGKTPASKLLVSAARQAARQWRFEPAWRGSRPVASELILKFQFHPAAQ